MYSAERVYFICEDIQKRSTHTREFAKGFFLPDNAAIRIGITTPRWSGNAVQRNRIKRIMREAFRLNRSDFPSTGSILFLVKRTNDETALLYEMFQLTAKLIAQTATVPRGTVADQE